jgi:transcriptional regulator GlxA family with amidase domain
MGLIDQLDAELRTRAAGFRYLATAAFMQLIGFLSRAYGRAEAPDAQALLRIATTITYLETHFAEEVRLDDLAGMAHMSKRAYLRAFQAATGQSPIAYLLQTRVGRAAALLRGTTEPVTDVAFRTGFSDSNYFARQFRRATGMTPRAYRAAARPRPM